MKRPLIDIEKGTPISKAEYYSKLKLEFSHTEGYWLIFRRQVWNLADNYMFRINEYEITFKKGFPNDGASIPKLLQWLFSTWDVQWNNGVLPHDGVYAGEIFPKWFNDLIMVAGMNKASRSTRAVFWHAVHWFGWMTYLGHRRKNIKRSRKFISIRIIKGEQK